jgi:hypothetical protein
VTRPASQSYYGIFRRESAGISKCSYILRLTRWITINQLTGLGVFINYKEAWPVKLVAKEIQNGGSIWGNWFQDHLWLDSFSIMIIMNFKAMTISHKSWKQTSQNLFYFTSFVFVFVFIWYTLAPIFLGHILGRKKENCSYNFVRLHYQWS